MKTKRGIELDLKQSKYFFDLFKLRFYFSSKLYLEKFKTNVLEYINIETIRNKNRYQVNFILNKCLAISFYKKIEKRGFRILDLENQKELDQNFYAYEKII